MRASRGAAFWGTVTCGREAQRALIRAPDSGGTPGWGGHAAWCGEQWGAACVVLLCATAFILHPAPRVLHPAPCILWGDWGLEGASRFGVHSRRGLHHGGVHAVPGLQHDGDPRFRGAPWGGPWGRGMGTCAPGPLPAPSLLSSGAEPGRGGAEGAVGTGGAFGEAGGGAGPCGSGRPRRQPRGGAGGTRCRARPAQRILAWCVWCVCVSCPASSVLRGVSCPVSFALLLSPCMLQPKSCTLHPAPFIAHPASCTQYHPSYTFIHPATCTLYSTSHVL